MPGVSPVRLAEWEVTSAVLSVVAEPYVAVVPYSTCVVAASLVCHEMVAAVCVGGFGLVELTLEIAGGVVSVVPWGRSKAPTSKAAPDGLWFPSMSVVGADWKARDGVPVSRAGLVAER